MQRTWGRGLSPFVFIVAVVLLSVGCLALLTALTHSGFQRMTRITTSQIAGLGCDVSKSSADALRQLAAEAIQNTAQSVAAQVEIYLAANPRKTVKDLQNDSVFQSIAVQRVGKTGYTAIQDYDRAINRFHEEASTVDLDLHTLADKLPEFWRIMEDSLGGHDSSGYYRWREPDGRLRDKYMYIATVQRRTADGVGLGVAATTYIDEFLAPITALQKRINEAHGQTIAAMAQAAGDTQRRGLVLLVPMVLSFALALTYLGRQVVRGSRALRASEAKFRGFFETGLDAIFIADPQNGQILDANPAAARLLGRDLSEIIGMHQSELHPPDKATEYRQKFERHIRECTAGDYEGEALRADGTRVPVFISANLVEVGGRTAIQGRFVDISERKRAEQELAELHRIISGSPAVVFLWENAEHWPVEFVSDNVEQLLGYTRQEFVNGEVLYEDVVHQEDLERVGNEVTSYSSQEGRETFAHEPYRIVTKHGEVKWVDDRTHIRRNQEGEITHYQGIIIDITDRKEAEDALGRERDRAQSYLQVAGVMLAVIEPDEAISLMNRKGCEMLGYSQEELIGKNWFDTLVPAGSRDEVRSVFAKLMREEVEPVEHYENPLLTKSGEERIIAFHNTVLKDEEGNIYGALTSGEDITDRKHAQEARERAMRELEVLNRELEAARQEAVAAAQAKSSFLARMSHEIRTPMNGVIGTLALAMHTELSAEQREFLEVADSSAQALLGTINDVLDFSKLEAGQLNLESTVFDVGETVEGAVETVAFSAAEKKIELGCHVAPDVPMLVEGDPTRLRQVLLNLLSNAVKFTESGEVIVRVEAERRKADDAWLLFSVRDTGSGIPREAQSRIFESFEQEDGSTTRKHGGSGLGLAIVRQLVDMMGGTIWVESEVGEGSTFGFRLPFPIAPEDEEPRAASPKELRGMRVLVVDDNATNRRVLSDYMKACGCVPTVAVSGADALEKLRATAPRAPYRLVLADAQMPEMDGFELARIITADPALKNAAVIILSSIGVGVAERVRDCGAAAYVTKPIRRSDLFEAVVEAQAPSPVRERSAAEDEPEYHTRCLQVLLAEDNPVNQKVAVRMLGKGGHTVHVVTTGAQAIRALQSDRYDLVLMDVQMPEMDGLEATRRIREDARFVDIPIVALTAHAMQGDRDGCLAAGMNDYLSKPFNQQELLAKLRQWDGSPGRDTAPEAPAQTGEPTCPAGVLDMDALVAVVEGDAEFAQSLISDFLAYTQEQLEKMDDAIAASDAQALGDLAHSIKGAAASLTADRVREAASRIEAMAHDGGHAGLPELVALLKAEADSLRQCADDNLAPSAPRRVT